MPEFHMRYTCQNPVQGLVIDFITRNGASFIIAKEYASREHLQCYVSTSIVKKTWDNKFRERFKELDRRDKYVKEDAGFTKQYVCKGGAKRGEYPDILAKRGFTDEDIIRFHNEYWDVHEEEGIKASVSDEIHLNITETPKEPKPEKIKKRTPTFMKVVRDKLEANFPDKEWTKKDKQCVFCYVMRELGTSCKTLDHVIVTRMTWGILNSLIKDRRDWNAYWYSKCFNEPYSLIDHLSWDENPKDDEFIEIDEL